MAQYTSHDVVAQLRSIFRVRRIGHTGTLDPFATGLLLCCVGRATKLSPYLMDLDKTYEGDLRLGVRTDTGDRTGSVVAEAPVPSLSVEELQGIAARFVGEQMQTPPMVSALKHRGRRLYELARMGVSVEREPRRIQVHELSILDVRDSLVHFRVRCGRGTYVRTLVEDLGRAAGTEGTVERLKRTAVGSIRLREAVDQSQILEGDVDAVLQSGIPMAESLPHHRALTLTEAWVRRVRQGTPPPWSVVGYGGEPPAPGDLVRLLGPEGSLVAMARVDAIPGPEDRHWADSRELVLQRVL
jgi:tRNA pseudouridine55 synthase